VTSNRKVVRNAGCSCTSSCHACSNAAGIGFSPNVNITGTATVNSLEEPSEKFKQVATYKVADEGTYAYPIATGNRIYVKDFDSVTLWTVD